MGHLKPLHATYTQEDVITARRKTTETPKRLASQNYYRTVDGIVTATHANGSYDVTVPGRTHPYPEVFCIIPRLKLEIHQGCTLGFLSNSPNLAMIVAVKFVGKRRTGNGIQIGEWQQAEGNFYLAQPGLAPDSMPSAFTDYLTVGSFSNSNLGLERMLGAVVADGAHIVAYYLGNGGLTAYSHLRIHAYTLTPSYRAPLWALEIPLDPEIAITTDRRFRAGFFWDEAARMLTICDRQTWSVLIPADITATPTAYRQTDLDSRYCASLVGRYMLLPTATGAKIYRRNDSRVWVQVGSSLTIDHNLALDVDSSSRCMSRPVPVSLDPTKWHILADSDSRSPSLVSVRPSGAVSTQALGIEYPAAIEIESALTLADTEHEANDPPFGPFPHVELLAIDDYGVYLWGGRSSTLAAGSGGSVYTCPRPGLHASNSTTAETFASYQWTGDAKSTPQLAVDSTGALIYAAVEPIPLVVPNSATYYTEAIVDTPYSPPGYTDPQGIFQARGVSGTYRTGTYTYYHQPKHGHSHRLVARKIQLDGTASWTVDLSSGPFSGADWTDYVSVALTEELPFPEAAWQVLLGPRTGGDAWQDAVFVTHGRRAAITDHERPALSAISSAGVLLDTLTDLAPLDLEMDGSYTWQVSNVRLVVNIGTSSKFALIGVYSESGFDQRKDIYLINLSDLEALTIEDSWTETNGTDYPRPQDFDRMTFSEAGFFWMGDHAGDPYWIRFE